MDLGRGEEKLRGGRKGEGEIEAVKRGGGFFGGRGRNEERRGESFGAGYSWVKAKNTVRENRVESEELERTGNPRRMDEVI